MSKAKKKKKNKKQNNSKHHTPLAQLVSTLTTQHEQKQNNQMCHKWHGKFAGISGEIATLLFNFMLFSNIF